MGPHDLCEAQIRLLAFGVTFSKKKIITPKADCATKQNDIVLHHGDFHAQTNARKKGGDVLRVLYESMWEYIKEGKQETYIGDTYPQFYFKHLNSIRSAIIRNQVCLKLCESKKLNKSSLFVKRHFSAITLTTWKMKCHEKCHIISNIHLFSLQCHFSCHFLEHISGHYSQKNLQMTFFN